MKFIPHINGRRDLDEPWLVHTGWRTGEFQGFLIALVIGVTLAIGVFILFFGVS